MDAIIVNPDLPDIALPISPHVLIYQFSKSGDYVSSLYHIAQL